MMRAVCRSNAPEATEALGAYLAQVLPTGAVVALYGDLASGKTCLVRGMARALGAAAGSVHSPTFTLVNRYGRDESSLNHLDLYRIAGPDELAELGWEEICEPQGRTVVEWAERAEGWLPDKCLHIRLAHGGGDFRHIEIEAGPDLLPEDFPRTVAGLPGITAEVSAPPA